MKTFILTSLLSFSAFGANFDCQYLFNLEEVHSNSVTIASGAKNVVIAEIEDYSFFISSLADGKYELQALSNTEETRTYAVSRLSQENPELGLVIWKRAGIVEVKCSLQQ